MPAVARPGLVPLHLNENLFDVVGPLPRLSLDPAVLCRYPRGGSQPLVGALAARHGVDPAAVFVNAGACGVLNSVFSLCANRDAVAVLPSPTWSYYHEVLGGLGLRRVEVPQPLDSAGYRYDLPAIARRALAVGATLVVVTSPNNPTGASVPYDAVEDLARTCASSLVILDEAYHGFVAPDPMPVADLLAACPNLVVVRTFSKALGLACLRVGFALAGSRARILLRRLPVPFGLAGYAQELAVARLADRDYLAAVRVARARAAEVLSRGFGRLPGFSAYASDANFILVRTPTGRSRAVRDHLAEHGFLVKLSDDTALPDHLRITLAEAPVMERVVQLVTALQSSWEAPCPSS